MSKHITIVESRLSQKAMRVIIALLGFVAGALVMFAVQIFSASPQITTSQIKLPDETLVSDFKPTNESSVEDYDYVWTYKDLNKEIKCLADNIYFEGRGESIQGQIAIGLVTINRVKSKLYPNSICEVVWQKNKSQRTGKWVAQFSWTLDGKSDRVQNKKAYKQIWRLAEAMLAEGSLNNFVDITNNATHYHASYVCPSWSKSLVKVAEVGAHIFYKRG